MGDQISWRSLLQWTLQVRVCLETSLSDHHQDQWLEQRSNSTMHQWGRLEISRGNLIHKIHSWIFYFHNPYCRQWLWISHWCGFSAVVHQSTKLIHEYLILIIHIDDSDFRFLMVVDFQLLVTDLTFDAVSTLVQRGFDNSESLSRFPKKSHNSLN